MNSSFNSGGSSSIVKDIVIGLIAVVVLYLVLGSFELLSRYINRLEGNRVTLLPITYQMNGGTKQLVQNPNVGEDKTITQSMNESTGTEFTYSFFLKVPQQAFTNSSGQKGLNHIFHKGSPSQYPLLGPGVYMRDDTNTLRVYMNSYDTWNNFTEVENFPIDKWCHVVIVCRSMHLEIYVNGNIVSRIGFTVSPPYQNYGDLYAFSSRRPTPPSPRPNSLNATDNFRIMGVCQGMLSKLLYFNYALSYSEINSLMNEGPSSKMDSGEMGKATNYLADNWWSADFTQ